MKRIGLTGGIGAGKSTVAAMFVARGASLIDADAISRQLMEPGSPVLAEVVSTFGQEILEEDGSLNRARLASLVFSSEAARQQLNAIMHPAIRASSARILAQAQQQADFIGVVLEDIPLLAETGQADSFDAVVVVYSDLETRLRRLTESRGMSQEDARARIAAQANDEQRAQIATWIIDNSGDLEETQEQVEKVWAKITKQTF